MKNGSLGERCPKRRCPNEKSVLRGEATEWERCRKERGVLMEEVS